MLGSLGRILLQLGNEDTLRWVDAADRIEIERAILSALGRRGLGGRVTVHEQELEYEAEEHSVSVDVSELLLTWSSLSPEEQTFRAEEICSAILYLSASRGSGSPSTPKASAARAASAASKSSNASPMPKSSRKLSPSTVPALIRIKKLLSRREILAFGAILVVSAVFAWVMLIRIRGPVTLRAFPVTRNIVPSISASRSLRSYSGGSQHVGAGNSLGETEADMARARTRACDAARERALADGSFEPLAMEGWIVEIWMAGRKGFNPRAGLKGYVEQDRLGPKAPLQLRSAGEGRVELVDTTESRSQIPAWTSAVLRLDGAPARELLSSRGRPQVVALADSISASAEVAALYGKCAHRNTHDLGVWYRGRDAKGAAAAMLYAAGFFAGQAIVSESKLTALDPLDALNALGSASSKLKTIDLAGIMADYGATVTLGDRSVTILFPVGVTSDAAQASQGLARYLGIGTNR